MPRALTSNKYLRLPPDLAAEVAEYRHLARHASETDALKRLIVVGLKTEAASIEQRVQAREAGRG